MRKDTDVDALRLTDQTVDGISDNPGPPVAPKTMADEDLGDPMRARKAQDRSNGIGILKDYNTGANLTGKGQVRLDSRLSFWVKARLADIDHNQLSMKALRVPEPTGNHRMRIRSRGYTDQDLFVGDERSRRTVSLKIRFELMIDHLGCEQ